jgi:hypothetical protein
MISQSLPYFLTANFAATADGAPQLNQTKHLILSLSKTQDSVIIALVNLQ